MHRGSICCEVRSPASSAAPPARVRLAGSSVDASDDQAAVQLSPEQRKAMIEGMVTRLRSGCIATGADVDGWLRLVRSYMVLGEPDKARAAIVDARRALAGDAVKLRRLDDLLRGLGSGKAEGQRTAQ